MRRNASKRIHTETLINPSCRRRPASSTLKSLDPGLRRDDEKGIRRDDEKGMPWDDEKGIRRGDENWMHRNDAKRIHMETLTNPSCRRRPASSTLKSLDPGLRRDDEKGMPWDDENGIRRDDENRMCRVDEKGMRRGDGKDDVIRINQNILTRLMSVLVLSLLLVAGTANAGVTLESFKFDTPAEELHFKKLIEEIRCLVCQNQSLVDSDAELAHDLRAEVYDMIQDGKSDEEIVEFLVARYGDFVLYNPPIKPSNYLIWFGPFVLLLVAGILLLRAVRRQKSTPAPEITPEERARLDAILGNTPPEKDKQQ